MPKAASKKLALDAEIAANLDLGCKKFRFKGTVVEHTLSTRRHSVTRPSLSARLVIGLFTHAQMNGLCQKAARSPAYVQLRFASAVQPAFGRTAAYRRLLNQSHTPDIKNHSPHLTPTYLVPLRSHFLPEDVRLKFTSFRTVRTLHYSRKLGQETKETKETKESLKEKTTEEPTSKTAESASKRPEAEAEATSEEEKSKSKTEEGEGKKEEKKEDLPPPPPHGDKSPWQVFTETLQTEFKASKEWNESTKALASSAHQFTESESVKRARQAYEASTSAVSSTGAKVLKTTAGAVGKGAAAVWETPVVKGVRSTVNATGRVIEKGTRPIRETEAFQSVKNVIDDGSSSRYGGWVEKEERRKARERREAEEAAKSGRPGRSAEVLQEDPK